MSQCDDELRELYATVPSTRRHLKVAREAAGLERQRRFHAASQGWLTAAQLAVLRIDQHWCESRALWCARCAVPDDADGDIEV
ncbi:ANR family transcriptional regulator [Serratia marcescens]|nr:ANR family transcriptional regulator [Serratia marcescens]MBH2766645.1 ANR family transcriptional regulator [Serratia marcescens]MBH2766705.1 ANR family transcriptional regulator [Serratia marcescens]